MTGSVTSVDVVTGMLGAAAGLAGLVLVFGGLTITTIQSYSGPTNPRLLRPFRIATVVVLIILGVSLLSVAMSATWLLLGGPSVLYGPTIALFFLQLLGVMFAGVYVTKVVVFA